jgi:hypothetical protein
MASRDRAYVLQNKVRNNIFFSDVNMIVAGSNSLDEPVWDTLKRDLSYTGSKMLYSLYTPIRSIRQMDSSLEEGPFVDWDLWGPFCLFFSYCVLFSRRDDVFTFNFSIGIILLVASAVIIRLVSNNHNVSLPQCICILGYSLISMTFIAYVLRFISYVTNVPLFLERLLMFGSYFWTVGTAFILILQTRTIPINDPLSTNILTTTSFMQKRSTLFLLPIISSYGFLLLSYLSFSFRKR